MPVNRRIRHHIGSDEFTACRVVAGYDSRILHSREIVYDPFHFRQFHPEPADLHQTVPPADKLNVPVQTVAGHVPGTVRCVILRIPGKRVGHESLFRFLRPVQVTACHLDPCHPEFAQGAGRHPPSAGIYHIDSRIIHGRTDGDIRLIFRHFITGDGNRSFRGPVFIGHDIGMDRLKGNQRFPAYHNVLQFRAVHGQGKLASHLGRQIRNHNMMPVDDLCQGRQIQLLFFRDHHDPRAYRKGRIHIRQRSVEAVAVITGYTEFFCSPEITPVPGNICHEILL